MHIHVLRIDSSQAKLSFVTTSMPSASSCTDCVLHERWSLSLRFGTSKRRYSLISATLLQSLDETLRVVREAMTRPHDAVQQQLNLDNDATLDNFIEDQGAFDEDLPYLTEGNLLPFLSSLELQQHDFEGGEQYQAHYHEDW